MKRNNNSSLPLMVLAIFAILMIGLNGCSKKINFSKSSVVPAAEGTVKIKKDRNKNYNVDISISNLAEPGDLTPSRSTYVVWMQTDQNDLKNIGQIKSSKKLFSNALTGYISTVTPHYPTKIFITAEDDGNIAYPQGETVLTTASF
jgi:hypothetical protein